MIRSLSIVGAAAGFAVVFLIAGDGWVKTINLAPDHLYMHAGLKSKTGRAQSLGDPTTSFEGWQRRYVVDESTVVFFEEDAHATVLVTEKGGARVLFVNGKPDASTTSEDLETQLMLAHAPLFMHPQGRSVMLIGHGSGITLGSILSHPVDSVDLVEVSKAVLHADTAFAEYNNQALRDARVSVYEEDGRSFLRTTPRRYDVIISEPSIPWMAGVSELFTVEFFEDALGHLEPGGIFAVWFHTYFQDADTIRLVLRSLAEVFPHSIMFSNDDAGNLVILNSTKTLVADFAGMEERFTSPKVRADLARLNMPNLAALLTHHRFSETRLRSLIGKGPLNTFMRQRLEYASIRGFFHAENAYFVEKTDPLARSFRPPVDILLDEYIAWRRSESRPVTPAELVDAARYAKSLGGYGGNVSIALLGRARLATAQTSETRQVETD